MTTPATPTAPVTPATPATPTAPVTPATPTAPVTPATPATPATPISLAPNPSQQGTSLAQVLAARSAAIRGETPPTPPADPAAPATPEASAVDPTIAAKDALFALAQTNPAQLAAMLQTVSGQAPQAPQSQTPAAIEPQTYAQQLQQEAYQAIQQRPEITAQELFGKDALEELGLSNQNYTPVLEQFIHATIAPVIGTLLSQMYALQHGVDQRFTDVQPMVQQAQFNQTQQEMGRKFITAFPALATDANAKAFAEKRFNDLAPLLMPRELLMNPHTNPAEYARLTESIVAIAAKEYQAPAAAPATPPPVAVSPAPPVQPAPSAYRNHLGQFQAAQPPTTLDAYNQQRIKTLFPGR